MTTDQTEDATPRGPRRGLWSDRPRWTYAALGTLAAAAVVVVALLPGAGAAQWR